VPPPHAGLLARLLGATRRASGAIYHALVLALLAITYVVVLPWFAAAWRLRARPGPGFRARRDPGVASIERLRSLF
jgi:hypothetical protein